MSEAKILSEAKKTARRVRSDARLKKLDSKAPSSPRMSSNKKNPIATIVTIVSIIPTITSIPP